MALLWTDDSEFTATTRTHFRGSHGASSVRWRTELLDHYTCQNSIRPTALREARSVRQYQHRSPSYRFTPNVRLQLLFNTAGKTSLTVTHTGHNLSNGWPFLSVTLAISKASPRCTPDNPPLTRFAALTPNDPRHPTNYKTSTRTRHTARHERLRTFTDDPRGEDRKRPSAWPYKPSKRRFSPSSARGPSLTTETTLLYNKRGDLIARYRHSREIGPPNQTTWPIYELCRRSL